VRGANVPALVRGTVAIFWYGAQTYIASTAVALLIGTFVASDGGATFLGLTAVGWVSFVIVWSFQMALFWNGIDWIRVFLNWAAPAVYAVMIALLLILWVRAGSGLLSDVGSIFEGHGTAKGGAFAAFAAVVGTMVAYFAAVILNFGDFSRYLRSTADMRLGNVLGLPVSLAFFSVIALFVTAGTLVVFGAHLTDPTAIIRRVDSPLLTVVAALTFFVATVGINVVANFVPPANDLSNLMPGRISFRIGGLIAASLAFVVGALWVTAIGQLGIARFVNTLGAILAPAYGIMIVDFYLLKRGVLDIRDLYSSAPGGAYAYHRGWNRRGLVAFAVAAVFSVSAVWLPALAFLNGFDWVIGAVLGGAIYSGLMARRG
jgi:NCS1 family nucleobase:cation symporter-1